MKTNSLWSKLTLVLTSSALALSLSAAEPKKVLVVTVTTGFRHGSIGTAEKILAQLAQESGAFTIVDYARQPGIKVPEKPNQPQKPKELAADAKEAAQAKYKADLAKFEAAEIKYKADLEKWNAMQDEVKAAQGNYDTGLKESLAKLSPENLKNFDAVIFANTTGNLPLPDKQGFIDWVKDGHGFIAMHSGSDTFHEFKPYIEMLGGEFAGHNEQVGVECLVQDMNHPATKALNESFCVEQEEIYLIKSFDRAKVHGLLALDKHPNKKKELGYFPIAWCKDFGQGKVFYTSLGHNEVVWENKRYQKHILGGIKWALGLEKGDAALGN
ncbi:MAG TPA: ThuA domain-containing protein [Verrucomicrobiae bacterium]